jgi:hypothetical protein
MSSLVQPKFGYVRPRHYWYLLQYKPRLTSLSLMLRLQIRASFFPDSVVAFIELAHRDDSD